MNKNLFRGIVAIPPLIVILLILLPQPTFPHTVQLYYEWWQAQPLSALDMVQYYGAFVVIVLVFISSAGVILFRRWARHLYLVMTIVLLLVETPLVPMLIWDLAALLDNIAKLAMGAVLAITFTPYGKEWFNTLSQVKRDNY